MSVGKSQEAVSAALRRRAAMLSLVIGVGMLFGKWLAYLLTHSHAILSDAMESVVHVAATAFALVSINLAARPPDPKFPYGYGKVSYFSAGFEGGLIALAALAILYESIQGLILGEKLASLDVGLILISVAGGVNLLLGVYLIRFGRATNSLILVADGQHVMADAYTSIGVIVGVSLAWVTGKTWLDGLTAIAVGCSILWTGWHLVAEAVTGLMDRADPGLLQRIVNALQERRDEGWIDLHQLRAWQSGDRAFVDFHLVVPEDWSVARIHAAHDICHDILRETLGAGTEVIIHFDPDEPGLDYHASKRWTVEEAVRVPEIDHVHGQSHATDSVPG